MGELHVEHVPTFFHSEIQGETIPAVLPGFPFKEGFLDKIVEVCPVVTQINSEPHELNIESPVCQNGVGLRRLTLDHGRSYEVTVGPQDIIPEIGLWQDEYKNVFTSLSLKGNNFSTPAVHSSGTAPSGYIPYGLQETDSFLRVMRASRMMREAEIDTEMIVRVVEPQKFRARAFDTETDQPISHKYEYVDVNEYKRRLLVEYWKGIADSDDALEKFKGVSSAINNMSFFITLRAMSTSLRIDDLRHYKNRVNLPLERLIATENIYELNNEDYKQLDPNNPDDIITYVTNYLPRATGANMAKLHNLGLIHTFPTYGNVNAFGGLVDLDSVKGEPLGLGDRLMTQHDFVDDMMYFINQGGDTFDIIALFSNLHYQLLRLDKDEGIFELYSKFITGFVNGYLHERFSDIGDDNEILVSPQRLNEFTTFMKALRHFCDFSHQGLYDLQLEKYCIDGDFPYESAINEIYNEKGKEFLEFGQQRIRDLLAEKRKMFIDNADDLELGLASYAGEEISLTITRLIQEELNNYIDPLLHTKEVRESISDWTFKHIRPELFGSHFESVRKLAHEKLADFVYMSTLKWFYGQESTKDLVNEAFDMFPHLSGINGNPFLIEGNMASETQQDFEWLWNNVMEDRKGEVKIAIKTSDDLIFESTGDEVIQQVLHDGELRRMEVIEKEDGDGRGNGIVHISLSPAASYAANLILKRKENDHELRLHVTPQLFVKILNWVPALPQKV